VVESPRRILIVRPSALGDVARTVPALVSLRRAFPRAQIDWLVNEAFSDAIAHHPDLNEVAPFPRGELARFGLSPRATRAGLRYFRDLRRRGYDTVYDLQGLGRSGWLTWVTRAPRRIGPTDARELGWLGYNRRIAIGAHCVHTVDRMLTVIEGDGVPPVRDMRLYPPPTDQQWATDWLGREKVSGPYVVLAPTAAWESKRWPADRFEALASHLAGTFDAAIIVGTLSERPQLSALLADKRERSPRRIDLVGQTGIGRLMAVIERAALVVANDSAALHLAVGLGRRCIGLYGPTDPAKVGPYRYGAGVLAGAGTGRLNYRSVDARDSSIASITVEQVVEKVRQIMHDPPPATVHG
jgi:heptosyltransferase I